MLYGDMRFQVLATPSKAPKTSPSHSSQHETHSVSGIKQRTRATDFTKSSPQAQTLRHTESSASSKRSSCQTASMRITWLKSSW